MKYFLPMMIGTLLLIGLLLALSFGYFRRDAFMLLLLLFAAMPLATIIMQGRKRVVIATAGAVAGGGAGLLIGYQLGPSLSEWLLGPLGPDYNIRLDLVLWCLLFASYGASLCIALLCRPGRK